MTGRARIERGVEAGADLFNTAFQLFPLKKCHEGRFIDFVALKIFARKKESDASTNVQHSHFATCVRVQRN
jgi:hypothetical protein